jgi:hypothetical protein
MVTLKIRIHETQLGDITCEQSKAYELINQFGLLFDSPNCAIHYVFIELIDTAAGHE